MYYKGIDKNTLLYQISTGRGGGANTGQGKGTIDWRGLILQGKSCEGVGQHARTFLKCVLPEKVHLEPMMKPPL